MSSRRRLATRGRTVSRAIVAAGASLATFAFATTSRAQSFCPSYTPAITAGGQNCAIQPAPGKNPDVATWHKIFEKVSGGKASWGSDGPNIGNMGSGCGKPKPLTEVPAKFPCHVLKAIAMRESFWQQFCVPTGPASEKGKPERTIVSFDCGYGIGQVTSGMHVGENPAFDRQRVASDPTYNLATGTQILLSKWRAASCVGDNDPSLVEDWYTAIWAYNGFAYVNNPNNPNLSSNRGVYTPGVHTGASHTYQEYVYGWMEHPRDDRWAVLPAAYPNRGDVGGGSSPGALPEPKCASPTSCSQTRPTHTSSCGGQQDDDEPTVDDAGVDSGVGAEDDASVGPNPPRDSGTGPDDDDDDDGDDTVDDAGRRPQRLKQSGDSGCSCRSAGASATPTTSGVLAGLGLVAGAFWARRRRSRARR